MAPCLPLSAAACAASDARRPGAGWRPLREDTASAKNADKTGLFYPSNGAFCITCLYQRQRSPARNATAMLSEPSHGEGGRVFGLSKREKYLKDVETSMAFLLAFQGEEFVRKVYSFYPNAKRVAVEKMHEGVTSS